MTFYWVCAVVTTISACISLGYSIVAVRGTRSGSSAEYALARSMALAAVSAVPLVGERRGWLIAVAVAMVIVQVSDAVIGARIGDRIKTFGPATTALVNLALLIGFIVR